MARELERFDLSQFRGRIAYEHMHRYAIGRESVAGKRVLDLACGTGYGSALLAQAGGQVTGIDISPQAIKAAKKLYGRCGVKFMTGDCFDLPFDDGSFDVVVANEMIEHVEDHDGLIAEVKRVLDEKGLFLVSTPNKPVYNRNKPPNAFHVSEMEIPEFRRLLTGHFREVHLTGTRMALLSVGFGLEIPTDKTNLAAARIFRGSVNPEAMPSIDNEELWLDHAEYILATCSDRPVEQQVSTSTLYYSREDDLWIEHEKIMAWASQLHDEDEQLRAVLLQRSEDVDATREALTLVERDKAALEERLQDVRRASDAVSNAIAMQHEGLTKDFSRHFEVVTRLVGHVSGKQVEADSASVAEALLGIGEQLAIQRVKLAELEETKARASTSELRCNELRAELDSLKEAGIKLEADRRFTERLQEILQDDLQRTKAQLQLADDSTNRLKEELQVAKLAEVNSRSDLERLNNVLEASQGDLSNLSMKFDDSKRELARVNAELAKRQEDAASLVKIHAEEAIKLETDRRSTERLQEILQDDLQRTKAQLQLADDSTNRLKEELQVAKLAEVNSRSDLERLNNVLEASQGDLSNLSMKFDDSKRELARVNAELAKRQEDAASLVKIQAVEVHRPTAAGKAGAAPVPIRDARSEESREQFGNFHRRVRTTLTDAPRAIQGRIPEARIARISRTNVLKRKVGISEAPFKTAIFDAAWIGRQVERKRRVTLARFLSDPDLRTVEPHPLFASVRYLADNYDVSVSGISPLAHYIHHGWREGRNPHPYFANDWYLEQNPDVLASGRTNPLDHYLQFGWREGRWPNPVFDPTAYLDRYPDIAAQGAEPLTHFVAYGQHEGREAQFRAMDSDWRNFLPRAAGDRSVMDYLLSTEPQAAAHTVALSSPQDQDAPLAESWPPKPLGTFWPPQRLRDTVIDGYGEGAIDLYWYLYSVMDAYGDRQAEFPATEVCKGLLARARQRAATAAARTETSGRAPDASIIIPVYNNIVDTLLCVVSVLELATEHCFEIIVADDGSTDATPQIITSIGGNVRYVRQPRNLGFLGNCNEAAMQATGTVVVLLNNDTLVLPNWLDPLLAPFESMERVGLVGSKLINWDGTLQEAGGIFWKDGSAWNFGRGQDARAPEFNYLKDVDYVSGAAIAIPMAVWRELGGFDPIYSPAYCEDADLAFRLRDRGYRTLYNPASEVIHHEGRSHGRDLASGIKAYQVTNQKQLVERWGHLLEREHYPNAQNVLRARDRSFAKRHVLVIDHYLPQWDRDAGSRSIYQYIKLLIEHGCAVSFWPENLWRDPHYTPQLQAIGVEVIFGPKYRDGFEAFIRERGELYDAVLLSRPHVAANFISEIRRHSSARLLYCGQDLHFARMEASRALGYPVQIEDIEACRKLELDVCRRCDVIFYPDPDEVQFMQREIGGNREFIANPIFIYDAAEIAVGRANLSRIAGNVTNRLLFIGGFAHSPNRDGIIWFVDKVMPLIEARIPDVMLDVLGSKVPLDVLDLARENIAIPGFVSDEQLAAYYAQASLAVAPLRFGAGVKGKVIEAMAIGVPVATTPTGAQGIDRSDQILFLGETAAELADAVVTALQDRTEAARRADLALEFIENKYSSASFGALLHRLVSEHRTIDGDRN